MSTPLNRDEQATVDRYEQLLQAQRAGQHVSDHVLNEAKQLAEYARHNAETRARQWAALDAKRQQEQQQRETQRQERISAEIEAMKRHARATFIGTPEQFEVAWPEILKQRQIAQTQDPLELEKQRLRQSGMYSGF